MRCWTRAADISPEHPTVISKFISGVKEIELDAVARDGEILVYAISEHVENAGVHSGDATLVLPPQRTYLETIRRTRHIGAKIAESLNITGPFNIQFLAQDNFLRVIECNLRASRSFPFVSKIFNLNFIELATEAIMNRPTQKVEISLFELNYVGVKAPHFSFKRLDGADPVLGVEMASTGEVACIGSDFEDALLKALLVGGLSLADQESAAEHRHRCSTRRPSWRALNSWPRWASCIYAHRRNGGVLGRKRHPGSGGALAAGEANAQRPRSDPPGASSIWWSTFPRTSPKRN